MTLYTFQADDGQTIDLPFSMAEVPSIGEKVDVDGRKYTRIFCGSVATGMIAQHSKYPYLSNSLSPLATHGAKNIRVKSGKHKVLIESQRHEREVMASNDLVKD